MKVEVSCFGCVTGRLCWRLPAQAATQFESIFWQIDPDSDRSDGDFRHNSAQFSKKSAARPLSCSPARGYSASSHLRVCQERSHLSEEEGRAQPNDPLTHASIRRRCTNCPSGRLDVCAMVQIERSEHVDTRWSSTGHLRWPESRESSLQLYLFLIVFAIDPLILPSDNRRVWALRSCRRGIKIMKPSSRSAGTNWRRRGRKRG